jgi:small GTP-binding protein
MSAVASKVCLLGDFGVGKTSLVARFVRNTFSDKYLTTLGVKVDSREVETAAGARKLVVWDIAGKSALDSVSQAYIRGATGLLLVADGTREATLRAAIYLQVQARTTLGELPAVLLVNKLDRVDDWEIKPATLAELRRTLPAYETSARTGDNVEAAFTDLAARLSG